MSVTSEVPQIGLNWWLFLIVAFKLRGAAKHPAEPPAAVMA